MSEQNHDEEQLELQDQVNQIDQVDQEVQLIYELGYWGGFRGLLHPIILLLEYLNINYTQKEYIDKDDWFEVDKPLHQCLSPYPNLPYLKKGDLIITESQAIIAFISYECGRFDLLGQEPFNTVQIIQVQGVHADMRRDLFKLLNDKENYQKIKDNFVEEKIQPRLGLIDKSLRGGYLIGDLSMVDFQMFETLDLMLKLFPNILNDHSQLIDYHAKFQELEGVKEYLQTQKFKSLNYLPKGYFAVDV